MLPSALTFRLTYGCSTSTRPAAPFNATFSLPAAAPEAAGEIRGDVSVDEEWSLSETVRHLVFADDCWTGQMLLGGEPFHPWGLPNTDYPADFHYFGWVDTQDILGLGKADALHKMVEGRSGPSVPASLLLGPVWRVVSDAAYDAGGPVLLVSHSAGCGIAHCATDARPDKVLRQVHVGGFPSADGEALLGWLNATVVLERFVVFEALISEGAPLATSWFADRQIGPTLLQFGTPEQQEEFLRGMQSLYATDQNKYKAILVQGGMTATPISINPHDAEFLAQEFAELGLKTDLYGSYADPVSGVVYALGDAGVILRSENGGKQWQRANTGDLKKSVRFMMRDPKSSVLVAFGREGTILRSEDDGKTWKSIENGALGDLIARLPHGEHRESHKKEARSRVLRRANPDRAASHMKLPVKNSP